MKKIIYSIVCVLIIGIVAFLFIFDFNNDDRNSNLEKVRVAEVAHTVFYAPQYAAISQGFFEEEGLDIEGVDKEEILEASEVFDVGDGRYLIVEA